jgi:hypothetical protein
MAREAGMNHATLATFLNEDTTDLTDRNRQLLMRYCERVAGGGLPTPAAYASKQLDTPGNRVRDLHAARSVDLSTWLWTYTLDVLAAQHAELLAAGPSVFTPPLGQPKVHPVPRHAAIPQRKKRSG